MEQLSRLFSAERINYFIVERHAPLTLFVESMKEKSPKVQVEESLFSIFVNR